MTAEAPVTMTESAARRIGELKAREGNPELKLRIAVNGGGCSGFQYAFDWAKEQDAGDIVVERDGSTVLIDSTSLLYLVGSEVDFIEDIGGSSFRIVNPNAQASCGCGTSFSV
jgi:iron-sulfur cluster insertion protein